MPVYFFEATLRVPHQGRAIQTGVDRGARGDDELTARRIILNQLFERGFQVVRLDRVGEPGPETVGESWA
jgi:hypothetical protein